MHVFSETGNKILVVKINLYYILKSNTVAEIF